MTQRMDSRDWKFSGTIIKNDFNIINRNWIKLYNWCLNNKPKEKK